MDQKIVFTNGRGQRLVGSISANDMEKKQPVFVFCHGFMSGKDSLKTSILSHLPINICLFRFDFSGVGESEGSLENTQMSSYLDDLKSAINQLENFDFVDREKIILVGASLGGFIASLFAAQDKRVKGLVLVSPVSDIREIGERKLKGHNLEEWKSTGYMTFGEHDYKIKLGYSFVDDLMQYNLYESAKNISCPVLIVHGDSDTEVPISHSQKLFETLLCDKKFVVLKGANHYYSNPLHFIQLVKTVLDWVKGKRLI